MDFFSLDHFWWPLLTIMGINILLSGDNAVVIALAAQALPVNQQKKAIFWGSLSAVFFLIVLTIFASTLLHIPYLRLIGACLLLWIGVKLLAGDEDDGDIKQSDNLWAAIRTILVANLVMSLDNILGVAGAAHDNNDYRSGSKHSGRYFWLNHADESNGTIPSHHHYWCCAHRQSCR